MPAMPSSVNTLRSIQAKSLLPQAGLLLPSETFLEQIPEDDLMSARLEH